MRITCWGSRGSIPVSGPDFNRYGGDTTCLEIRSADDDILIVDAGTGIRALGNTLFLSLIHISEPTRLLRRSRMPSSA